MNPKSIALVSPRDRQVVPINLKEKKSIEKIPVVFDTKAVNLGDYFSRFPATEFVNFSNEKELQQVQKQAEERASALDFILMLFDPDHSIRVKIAAAQELDELLADEANRNYVLDILLAYPLSNVIDFQLAKHLSIENTTTNEFVRLLETTRERANLARNAWLAIRNHLMIQQNGQDFVRGQLILSGVFRRAIIEIDTKGSARFSTGNIVVGAKPNCDPRIVDLFLREYIALLPEGDLSPEKPVDQEDTYDNEQFKGKKGSDVASKSSSRYNSIAEQTRAVREVEEIARLYLEGRNETATKYLDELIVRQAEQPDHSHLVKSLCNIASKCTTGGRYDIAANCLVIASNYERSVDCRLYIQMANLFKELRKFDQAANCLRRAEDLAANTLDRDLINRELARLLSARGDYHNALESFRRLSDINESPESRTSMATVLRKMGALDQARSIYENVWNVNRKIQAFAGLAEVNRHTGRFTKAIKKYTWILDDFREIDDRSQKIYKVALSSLYSTFGKIDEARSLLEQLHAQYPADSSIQLAMAKVYRLLGENYLADKFYHESSLKLPHTEKLAAQLYETAIMTKEMNLGTESDMTELLPEFHTLYHCNFLLRSLISGNVQSIKSNKEISNLPNSPYKLHRDFNAVLRYHAAIAVERDISRVSDPAVNRIRKRGLIDLKMAVRAIDFGNFDAAIRYEQRIALRVA